MKWLALLFLVIPTYAQSAATDIARTAGAEFGRGDLGELRARFTPQLQGLLSPVRLFLTQRSKLAGRGGYTGLKEARCYPAAGHQRCLVDVSFSDELETISLAVTSDGLISGFLYYGVVEPTSTSPSWYWEWFPFLVPLALMVVMAAVNHFIPMTARHDKALRARYQRWSLGLTLGCGAIVVGGILARIQVLYRLEPMLQSFGPIFVLIALAARWNRPAQLLDQPVRTATLGPVKPLPWWIWLLLALPVVILAGAATYAATRWNEMPEPRTFKSIFGVLLMSGSGLILAYAHTFLVMLGARRSAEVRAVLRANIMMLVFPQLCMIGILAIVTIPTWQLSEGLSILMGVLPLAGATAAIIPFRRLRALEETNDAMPNGDWRGGLFYVNRSDPAWVIRRGLGFAPNYGHPWIVAFGIAQLVQFAAVWIYLFAT